MKYEALVSFAGKVHMAMGEIGEIADLTVANDLLKAGYIKEIKEAEAEPTKKAKAKGTNKR